MPAAAGAAVLAAAGPGAAMLVMLAIIR